MERRAMSEAALLKRTASRSGYPTTDGKAESISVPNTDDRQSPVPGNLADLIASLFDPLGGVDITPYVDEAGVATNQSD